MYIRYYKRSISFTKSLNQTVVGDWKELNLWNLFILKLYLYSSLTGGAYWKVMLQSGKYDLVHEFFRKMAKSGEAIGALTYKGSSPLWATLILYSTGFTYLICGFTVLVRAFWEEGKINEAVAAVRNMEQRGVVGTASVYYELACCLCNNGRWQDAMLVVSFFLHRASINCCWYLSSLICI